jgi:hypothetical protein
MSISITGLPVACSNASLYVQSWAYIFWPIPGVLARQIPICTGIHKPAVMPVTTQQIINFIYKSMSLLCNITLS